jgi:hypothetical protein
VSVRRALLFVPLALVLLMAVAYVAAETWLESAGGKRALEKTLSSRIGMPVRLGGDFNLRLLPSVSVSATQLAVSDPSTGEEVATGNYIEADLALAPLFREELDVSRLSVEGLRFNLPGGNGLFFPRVTLASFGIGRPTEFDIDWNWMGRLNGQFTWFASESRVHLNVLWRAQERDDIGYRGSIVYGPGVVRFGDSEVTLGKQSANGGGCLLMGDPPQLNLVLKAGRLDVDELMKNVPGGQGATGSLPVELNLRLDAAEIRRGETVAYDTKLELGRQPACP